MGLFLVLVAAVVVRETARILVAAWLGLRMRAILLLPIGGLFAYANPESQEKANAAAANLQWRSPALGQLRHSPGSCRYVPGRER